MNIVKHFTMNDHVILLATSIIYFTATIMNLLTLLNLKWSVIQIHYVSTDT